MKRKLLLSFIVCTLFFAMGSFAKQAKAFGERYANIDSIFFQDKDPDKGEIGGVLTFSVVGNDTLTYDKYEIVFENWEYSRPKITEVKATGKNLYSVTIPENTAIPSGSSHITVNYVYKEGIDVDFLGRLTALVDNVSSQTFNSIDINVPEELAVSYDEWELGMNSDTLAPWISIYTKDRLNDWNFKDKNKEYTPNDVRYASLYFLDGQGNKLEAIGDVLLRNGENSIRFPALNSGTLPAGAKAIGVYAKNAFGESKDYIGVGLLNYPNSRINEISFLDQDPITNMVSGTLIWKKPKSEDNFFTYGIYITKNYGNQVIKKLGEVKASDKDAYTFTIPVGTELNAENGEDLRIVPEFHGFVDTSYPTSVVDRNPETIKARTLLTNEVEVEKDSENAFSLTINSDTLKAHDTIKIYDQPTGGKLLRTADLWGGGYISMGFNRPIGLHTIYVSITNIFGVEGNRTPVTLDVLKVTPTLAAKQVSVVNNSNSKADVIKVSGLVKGDTVRIYDGTGKKLLAALTSGGSTLTTNIKQLSVKSGSIFISRQQKGLLESTKLRVNYSAEPSLSLNTSQIKIANNKMKSDTISVSGIAKGDIVRIYDGTGKKLLVTLTSGGSTVTVNIKQLSEKSGSILISKQQKGLLVSPVIRVNYLAEPSLALKTSQIKITNNKKKSDTVSVSGITKGDTIYVYNKATKRITSKKATASKMTISIKQLGSKSSYLWVSITKNDLNESPKVKVSFKAE